MIHINHMWSLEKENEVTLIKGAFCTFALFIITSLWGRGGSNLNFLMKIAFLS